MADSGAQFRVVVTNAVGSVSSSAAILTVSGTGTGLQGQYYDNSDFTYLKLTRIDATVNFNWGTGSPHSSIGANTFSVRWTGQVQPQYSEAYTFHVTHNDGARLWVNNQLIVNNWTNRSSSATSSGSITLVAGQKYNLQLDYYENTGSAVAQLAWSSPRVTRQIIPAEQLYLPALPPAGTRTLTRQQATTISALTLPQVSVPSRATWNGPVALQQGTDLHGVWGSADNQAFAVGSGGVILYYNGHNWSLMTSGTTQNLLGIWGHSESEIFVVGGGGTTPGGVILHYDGDEWSTPMPGEFIPALHGVWGTAGNNVFAVGADGTILHYDGHSWSTPMPSGTPAFLRGIWGRSASDIFVVGDGGTILHYDGHNWSTMESGTELFLHSVWGTGENHVFALGESGTILHYDGHHWSTMKSGTELFLHNVWGTGENDVFAVGESGTILHYDGHHWSTMKSGTDQTLWGVWGGSLNDVFVVGDGGLLLHHNGQV